MPVEVVGPRQVVSVDAVVLARLPEAGRRQLGELFETVHEGTSEALLRVRQNRIGSVVLGGTEYRVVSDIRPRTLLSMLLYAAGLRLEHFLDRDVIEVEKTATTVPDLLVLVAYLMGRSSAAVLERHVVQRYVRVGARSSVLRGTVRWERDFGRPSTARWCEYHEKRTDNDLNRLVLAGLDRAVMVVSPLPAASSLVRSQQFIWRDLVQPAPVDDQDFVGALAALDRLSEHYRPALTLARLLVSASGPGALFGGSGAALQAIWFDIAAVFEAVVARAVSDVLEGTPAVAVPQDVQHGLLVDGAGRPYRSIRPDIVVYRVAPRLVIDAKFKRRYVESVAAGKPSGQVTSSDIYQLYFYAERLARRHQLTGSLPAYVVAPVIDPAVAVPARARRTIRWQEAGHAGSGASLEVLPFDVDDFLGQVAAGEGTAAALAVAAAELLAVLQDASSDSPA